LEVIGGIDIEEGETPGIKLIELGSGNLPGLEPVKDRGDA
jgi:hypothetical protein